MDHPDYSMVNLALHRGTSGNLTCTFEEASSALMRMNKDATHAASLKSHNAALRAMLGELEWDGQDRCPVCGQQRTTGHYDCRLAALLREGEK